MSARRIVLVTAASCTVAIAGCGPAASSGSASSAAAVQTTAAPSPTPTPDLHAAAAKAYLAWATAGNKVGDSDNAALNAATTLAQQHTAWKKMAQDTQKELDDLLNIQFPPEMKSDVDGLIKAMTAEVNDFNALSQDSGAALNQDASQLQADGNAHSAAAQIIRHDLGLPPVPQ